MTEDDIYRDIARSDAAKRILGEPLVREAFAVIEREIVDQLKAVPERDAEGRDLLVRLLKLNEKYRGIFLGWIEAGKLAGLELEKSRLQQAKNFIRKAL